MGSGSGIGTGNLGGSAGFALRSLEKQIDDSTTLAADAKASLSQGVQDVKEEIRAYAQDKWFYRIVVIILGIVIVLVVCAISVLVFHKTTGFDALTAIGSAAIGGLVGLLAPSPVGSK
jgi:hypothetical protein